MVVISDDRNILGDRDPSFSQDAINRHREAVVAAADGCRRRVALKELVERIPDQLVLARCPKEIGRLDKPRIEFDPGLFECVAIPPDAEPCGLMCRSQGQIGDPAMARGHNCPGQSVLSALIVRHD